MPEPNKQKAPDTLSIDEALGSEENPTTETAVPQQSLMQRGLGMAGDVLTGAGKGALHTMSQGDEWARQHLPAFMTNQWFGLGKPANLQHVQQMATPTNTAQKIGYGGEQIGEFLIPGAAEEAGAAKLASLAPRLGKAALPLAKIGTSALSSGLVNKAQGGEFGTGALMGAGGAAVGQGIKAAAPAVAEAALGIPKAARAFGKTPGKAIINETRGIRPETIAASAQERMGQLTPELEQTVAASPNMANLGPARQVLTDAQAKAAAQNAAGLHGQIGTMADTLARRFDTGAPIPATVTPSELLNLKRGFGEEHVGWNPEIKNRALNAARQTYGALDTELDRAVPAGRDLNQRISSLIPVAKRAESVARNAPTPQRVLGRVAAHTGAGLGAVAGGTAGYREGGVPGAIAGGLTGLVAPELIASPEGQMIMARTMNKANALKPLTGSLLQFNRKKEGE